jgi:hypothetical protein
MVCGLIAQPYAGQRSTPPEKGQNRRPAIEVCLLSLTASRAASTHSCGIPDAGIGTATHSLRGFRICL